MKVTHFFKTCPQNYHRFHQPILAKLWIGLIWHFWLRRFSWTSWWLQITEQGNVNEKQIVCCCSHPVVATSSNAHGQSRELIWGQPGEISEGLSACYETENLYPKRKLIQFTAFISIFSNQYKFDPPNVRLPVIWYLQCTLLLFSHVHAHSSFFFPAIIWKAGPCMLCGPLFCLLCSQ